MKDYGAVMRGLADTALERVFGAEWIDLDSKRRRLVMQDFLDASEQDNVTASEYARRIGKGNLKAYGDVMLVRERKRWDKNPSKRKRRVERSKYFWVQTQAPAGNWVDNTGTQSFTDAKRYMQWEKKQGRKARVVERHDTILANPAFKHRGIAKVHTRETRDTGGIHIKYHDTEIVTVHPDHTVTLRSGGWLTTTTKRRMNQVSDAFALGFGVYQKKHNWYVTVGDKTLPFTDGMNFPIPPRTNPAGQYGPRIRKAARQMVRKYGKRRARSIAGGMIGTSRSRRQKEHFVKVRRAINPRRTRAAIRRAQGPSRGKYEIFGNGRWFPVSKTIFRSWAGKRRLNGKPYRGHVYYLGTNNIARSMSRGR